MSDIPTLRVELDGVKTAILTHLETQHEVIKSEIQRQLEAINIEELVSHAVRTHVPPLVSECVKRAVTRVVEEITYDNGFTGELKSIVETAFRDAFRKRFEPTPVEKSALQTLRRE